MMNLLRSEFYKFVRNKTFWVITITIVSLTFVLVLLQYLNYKGVFEQVENITIEINEQVTEASPLSGIKMFLEAIHSPDLFLTILLISFLGSFFIANESSDGTIKNLVSVGQHRSKVYMAKYVVFSIGSIIITLLISFMIGIFGTIFFGIGDLPANELIVDTIKVAFLTCIYIGSFAAIVMFFSMIFRGTGVAILLSLGFYLIAGAGLRVLSFSYNFGRALNKYSVYYRYSTFLENDLNTSNMVELAAIPTITAMIFIIIGLAVFQRKDIS